MASAPSSTRESPVPSSGASSVKSVYDTPPSGPVQDIPQDESSKLRIFLGILRKFIGVADIASVRFSLPAQLLEPIPNLEYWHYLDRPETFISIGKSDDDLERMLEVLRFWFTKDLKYVKGKPCKPYNSTLGEFFRCLWVIQDTEPPIAEIASPGPKKSPENVPTSDAPSVKISYITEQTSHHPPVSAYYIDCPEKGITARGFDQISAKFTGTAIRVTPGNNNLGIFINLANRDNEEYQMTHPAANLGGLLRGSLSITVSDQCYITCPKTRLKVILNYVPEGWLGKTQNQVLGAIFRYDPSNDKILKLKDVPEKDIICKLDGCWKDKVYCTFIKPGATSVSKLASSRASTPSPQERYQLIDLNPLMPVPKEYPPPEKQLPNESRRFWGPVTDAITSKQFNYATKLKQDLEERQRTKAAEREKNGVEWKPRFFTAPLTPVGRPDLSEEGQSALQGLHDGRYDLKENEEIGYALGA